jgi:O-methyltransferase
MRSVNPIQYWSMRIKHKLLHRNELFYTLTPELAIALISAFKLADKTLMDKGAGYYEFGLFKGYTLWIASRLDPTCPLYGFDSFTGMPPSKGSHPHHARGGYAASMGEVEGHLMRHGTDMRRVHLFQGYFSEQLFDSVSRKTSEPVGVAVIDCDLYDSCVPVLEFLRPRLRKGSILLFDDFFMEPPSEKTALEEFCARYPKVQIVPLEGFGIYGMMFRVAAVR